MKRISVMPEATSSSTMKSIEGRVTSGSISFGMVFVTGRNRVPYPAVTMTPFMAASIAETPHRMQAFD